MSSLTALDARTRYVLGLGDDALIMSHRLGEWITRAPQLEEDVALANLGLDLLGQARALLTHAGALEGAGRDEDALAYRRDERDFLNLQIVEIPNGDFAVTTARALVFSAYQFELYTRLAESSDETLAAIAAKAVKEVAYHRDHATQWTLRLGDGTEEGHRRMQAGLAVVWPYVDEIFEPDPNTAAAVHDGVAVDVTVMYEPWRQYVHGVIDEATLAVPEASFRATGGRQGIHTESMGYLLAEMQHLHRAHPGATW